MSVTLRWVGEEDYERVALTRMRCYAAAAGELPRFREGVRADPRAAAGDFLLAEDAAEGVGTATSHSFTAWVRGSPHPCQGVAFVGTVRTRRRSANRTAGEGVASLVMRETLRKARERGQVLSALMPFRASFYEHFGYGVVERRVRWVVPLSVLPAGPCDGLRYARPDDRPAIAALHQRTVEAGQCDLERSPARWDAIFAYNDAGFEIVDPADDGTLRGSVFYRQYSENGKDILDVQEQSALDPAAFVRQLHFLASLKDQYAAASLILPADLPLNWLLRESQLPHRLVNHATAAAFPHTRMQVRVLDHQKLLEGMRLAAEAVRPGEVVVRVRESEGHVSTFRLTFGHESAGTGGRVRYDAAGGADDTVPSVECDDRTWAAIALGDMPARQALRLGLLWANAPRAVEVLNPLAAGPLPFNREYF